MLMNFQIKNTLNSNYHYISKYLFISYLRIINILFLDLAPKNLFNSNGLNKKKSPRIKTVTKTNCFSTMTSKTLFFS